MRRASSPRPPRPTSPGRPGVHTSVTARKGFSPRYRLPTDPPAASAQITAVQQTHPPPRGSCRVFVAPHLGAKTFALDVPLKATVEELMGRVDALSGLGKSDQQLFVTAQLTSSRLPHPEYAVKWKESPRAQGSPSHSSSARSTPAASPLPSPRDEASSSGVEAKGAPNEQPAAAVDSPSARDNESVSRVFVDSKIPSQPHLPQPHSPPKVPALPMHAIPGTVAATAAQLGAGEGEDAGAVASEQRDPAQAELRQLRAQKKILEEEVKSLRARARGSTTEASATAEPANGASPLPMANISNRLLPNGHHTPIHSDVDQLHREILAAMRIQRYRVRVREAKTAGISLQQHLQALSNKANGKAKKGPRSFSSMVRGVAGMERMLKASKKTGEPSKAASIAAQMHEKFAASGANMTFGYSGLDAFYGGLEMKVGTPWPDIFNAMQREHASTELFNSHNVFMTTPKREFNYCATMEVGELKDRSEDATPSRLGWRLANFVECDRAREGKLRMEEVLGLRLYTGPMYVHYNNLVLRAGVKGEYVTTIHAVNSAIVKLSKLQQACTACRHTNVAPPQHRDHCKMAANLTWQACTVYRGVSGGVLPQEFWTPDKQGVMGGVESAFMSTTTDRAVALRFATRAHSGGADEPAPSKARASMLLQIRMGMIDRGADVSAFSQFPAEAEILFAPLTGLEVVSRPWAEGSTIVVELRLSCNLRDLTIDQVIGKMKRNHIELIQLMADDLKFSGAPPRALLPLMGLRNRALNMEAALFNLAKHYRAMTAQALEAQSQVIEGLKDPASWDDETLPAKAVAQNMRSVVAVQARAGEYVAATELLITSLQKVKLPSRVQEQVFHAMSAVDGAVDELDERKLEAAAFLLAEGAMPPYPRMLATLVEGMASEVASKAFGALVAQNNPQERFSAGAPVLAFDTKAGRWTKAEVVKAGGERAGLFTVNLASGQEMSGVAPMHVVRPTKGGPGAILLNAAERGNAALVDALLKAGVSPNEADKYASTALQRAVMGGHTSVCKRLIAAKADPEVPNVKGLTAWDLALQQGHHGVRRVFSPSGSDRDVAQATKKWDAQEWRVLHAAGTGDRDGLKEAVKEEEETVRDGRRGANKIGPANVTPLMLAARCKSAACVSLLLQMGARKASRSQRGCTALGMAAEEGATEVVKMLLADEDDANGADAFGYTPLQLACENGHDMCAAVLIEDGGAEVEHRRNNGWTPLMTAAYNGCTDVVRVLVKASADVNMAKDNGFSALLAASLNGFSHSALALIEGGASLDQPLNNGWTALMVASSKGHAKIVHHLLEAGAEVDRPAPQDSAGRGPTSLMSAASGGHEKCIVNLVKFRALIDKCDHQGSTALHYACQGRQRIAAQMLVEAGANIRARRVGGRTPLMEAALAGDVEVVWLLVQMLSKPDIDAQDDLGATALMLGSIGGHERVVLALLQSGATKDLEDSTGQTAIMHSSSKVVTRRLFQAGAVAPPGLLLMEEPATQTSRKVEKQAKGAKPVKVEKGAGAAGEQSSRAGLLWGAEKQTEEHQRALMNPMMAAVSVDTSIIEDFARSRAEQSEHRNMSSLDRLSASKNASQVAVDGGRGRAARRGVQGKEEVTASRARAPAASTRGKASGKGVARGGGGHGGRAALRAPALEHPKPPHKATAMVEGMQGVNSALDVFRVRIRKEGVVVRLHDVAAHEREEILRFASDAAVTIQKRIRKKISNRALASGRSEKRQSQLEPHR